MGICVNLICVEFVLENWPIKEKYQELKNRLGKAVDLASIACLVTALL